MQDVIKVNELARKLQVPNSRIKLLVKAGHLKLVNQSQPVWYGHKVVYLPPPAALEWIKAGFAPLRERPIIKVWEAAKMAQCSIQEFRRLCMIYDIPIHVDLAYGELVTVDELTRFTEALYARRDPARFDRGAILHFLRGVKTDKKVKVKPLAYSEKMEKEIKRVMLMNEPERTIRATTLVECYREAKTVADCLGKYNARTQRKVDHIERVMGRMVKVLTR